MHLLYTLATSNVCTTTYAMSSPIVLAEPFVLPKIVLDSGKPIRKRDCSGSSSDVSHDKMWAEFQHFWAFYS